MGICWAKNVEICWAKMEICWVANRIREQLAASDFVGDVEEEVKRRLKEALLEFYTAEDSLVCSLQRKVRGTEHLHRQTARY